MFQIWFVIVFGPIVKNGFFLIGFRFLQGDAFYRHSLQVDAAVIPAVAKVQGIASLGDQHIFFFPFGPHHEAAKQAARIGAHDFPVILEERVFRGDVLREFFKILFAQNDNLCHFKNAGDVVYLVSAQAVQCFGVCRERGVLLFSQYFHLSFLEQNQPVQFSGGLGRSPRCVWISKRYACKTSHRLAKKKRPQIRGRHSHPLP